MKISEVTDDKRAYMELLLIADEQESMVEKYLERGMMFVLDDDGVKAECVVTDEGNGVLEIKNIAVDPNFQNRGYGRELIKFVEQRYKKVYGILRVGTGDSPLTVPFYKKCGFTEKFRIKDFFTENYDHPIVECGVLLTDMVCLEKELKVIGGGIMVNIIPFRRELWEPCVEIWNSIVEDGEAFPQTEMLDEQSGTEFFQSQSYTGVAVDSESGEVVGLYILHPNNVGRCGHICNASYAVKKDRRGRHIGEALVRDCMKKGKELGFGILQFNAVVAVNHTALALYKKLGFTQLGVIPKGFRMKSGRYEDIIPHFIEL